MLIEGLFGIGRKSRLFQADRILKGMFCGVFFLVLISARANDYIVTNLAANGEGTLFQAITNANYNEGTDRILFAVKGTIRPTNGLPSLIDPVIIDATVSGDYAWMPLVELSGELAGGSASGLRLLGGDSVVRGLAISRFALNGIDIQGLGNNVVEANFLGVGLYGTNRLSNGRNVRISNSSNNRVGGTNASQRNIISGASLDGVYLIETAAFRNTIQGNYIGLDITGTKALTNAAHGIMLVNGANKNVIGGTNSGAGNVISGNSGRGIYIESGCSSNIIQGNIIGLNAQGTLVVTNGGDGVYINKASDNVVGGTTAASRNIISGNTQAGVSLVDTTTARNIIQGNFIGTDITGLTNRGNKQAGIALDKGAISNLIGGTITGAGNVISGNQQQGILILTNCVWNRVEGNKIGVNWNATAALSNVFQGVAINSACFNTIGGTNPAAKNIISGNGLFGISIQNSAAISNYIVGNFVGTDASGMAAIANSDSGILIDNARTNFIGGALPSARNLVSGNESNGIAVNGSNARGNFICGNYVGTDVTGNNALGNGTTGILLSGAIGNYLGGTDAGEGNLVSGNADAGIYLYGVTTSNNWIQGNTVGADASGTVSVRNGRSGIYLYQATRNTIGGAESGARNLVSGNSSSGIYLDSDSAFNVIQGNYVGTAADGISNLRNGYGGDFPAIELWSNAHDNIIGGSNPGAGNRIAYAGYIRAGIRIRHTNSVNNLISGNAIFSNDGLGIQLGTFLGTPHPNGAPYANDHCDTDSIDSGGYGGNQLQNYPELTEAYSDSTSVQIKGRLDSAPYKTYTLEFFANATCESSGFGEGQIFLGQSTVAVSFSCSNSFNVTLPVPVPAGYTITATATDPTGNTSEFSPCRTTVKTPEVKLISLNSSGGNASYKLAWTTPTNAGMTMILLETTNLVPAYWVTSTVPLIVSNGETMAFLSATNRFYRLKLK